MTSTLFVLCCLLTPWEQREVDAAVEVAIQRLDVKAAKPRAKASAKPRKPVKEPVKEPADYTMHLLMIYDGSEACKRQFPIMEVLKSQDYHVVFANAAKPGNSEVLKRFNVDVSQLPLFVIGKGHEVLGMWYGEHDRDDLGWWYWNTFENKPTVGPIKATMQANLAEIDRPYLHTYLGPSTCWMADCPFHRPTFVEVMDDSGKVNVAKQVQLKGSWAAEGEKVALTEACNTCPNKIQFTGKVGQYWRVPGEEWLVYSISDSEGMLGWHRYSPPSWEWQWASAEAARRGSK